MQKAWYLSVSDHCLRYYAKHRNPGSFPDDGSRRRWEACQRAVTDADAEVVDLFAQRNTKAAVYRHALANGVPQGEVWAKVRDLERRVAGELGLI
jgi:hypothetical protein